MKILFHVSSTTVLHIGRPAAAAAAAAAATAAVAAASVNLGCWLRREKKKWRRSAEHGALNKLKGGQSRHHVLSARALLYPTSHPSMTVGSTFVVTPRSWQLS
jgi:hypothetical protein